MIVYLLYLLRKSQKLYRTMNKPEVYVKINTLPQIDADYTLNKKLAFLNDSNNYNVLDVGCGPGNVTFEKVLPLLPTTTRRVLGVDVSRHHIEYARKHYQNDSRISYEVLDILTDVVPNEYVSAFDMVLSLHCFQFVGNHRKAFANIYKMLKPNSKMLITFIGQSVLNNVYREISNQPKWKKYMTDDSIKSIPPYNSTHYYETLLKEIGFKEIQCEEVKTNKLYPKQEIFDILTALNVYTVPKSKELEFIEDHMSCLEQRGCFTVQDDGRKIMFYEYDMFIITAKKYSL